MKKVNFFILYKCRQLKPGEFAKQIREWLDYLESVALNYEGKTSNSSNQIDIKSVQTLRALFERKWLEFLT